MGRRRWAPLAAAAAACLVALVVLAAAAHGAPGGGGGAPMPASRRSGASGRGEARVAAFDAAAASAARCTKQGKGAAAAPAPAPACAGSSPDDVDKRVVPTGANPLHNSAMAVEEEMEKKRALKTPWPAGDIGISYSYEIPAFQTGHKDHHYPLSPLSHAACISRVSAFWSAYVVAWCLCLILFLPR